MNTKSRMVVCLIAMMLPVTAQAGLGPSGWDNITKPWDMLGPEGADTLTPKWEWVNNTGFTALVMWSNFSPTFYIVDNGGDPTDRPTISAPTVTPGLKYDQTNYYSEVPNGTNYAVSFQVIAPKLDTEPEVPIDTGFVTVGLKLDIKLGNGAWTDYGTFSTATYTYYDPGYLPEPATLALFGIGAIGLRARRKQAA